MDIKVGDRLTILVHGGLKMVRSNDRVRFVPEKVERTGRVVIVSGDGTYALDMGGRYGTPGFANASNIVAHQGKRIRRTQ